MHSVIIDSTSGISMGVGVEIVERNEKEIEFTEFFE